MLQQMQQEYAEVQEGQKLYFGERIKKIVIDIDKMEGHLQNMRCRDPEILAKLAPLLTSSYVVNSPEIIDMIIDDLIEEEVHVQNELEAITHETDEFIALKLKRNRLKAKLASTELIGAWQLVETLEQYKADITN